MKKLLLSALLIFNSALTMQASALSCEDIKGVWRGNLDGFSNVQLQIKDTGGGFMEDASISFRLANGTPIEYCMLVGQCQQATDGQTTMHFTRSNYGVNANLETQLLDANRLAVT